MRKLICCGLVFGALLAGPMAAQAEGAAPEPAPAAVRDEATAKLRLARRFIAAIQTDQMGAMLGQMTTAMTPPRAGMSQAESDAVRSAIQRAGEQMLPRMFDAMAPIYADIFTMEELNGLVDFYESDIGRSMIQKSYAAAPRMTQAMMAMMPELMHDMADTMCKELDCTAEERARMDAAMAQAGFGPRPSASASSRKN
jgi:hypothetical protein